MIFHPCPVAYDDPDATSVGPRFVWLNPLSRIRCACPVRLRKLIVTTGVAQM